MCHDSNSRHDRSPTLLCVETTLLLQPYESYGRRYRMDRFFGASGFSVGRLSG